MPGDGAALEEEQKRLAEEAKAKKAEAERKAALPKVPKVAKADTKNVDMTSLLLKDHSEEKKEDKQDEKNEESKKEDEPKFR